MLQAKNPRCMAVLVIAFAATLVSACKDEDLCGPFEVSEDGTSCVCPPPFEVSGDGLECVCPAGFVEEGDECLRLDGGAPVDASLPDATTPPGDGGADSCTPRTFYRDGDGDGRGTEDESQVACTAPPGFVDNADDCNDGCDSCWTDAAEACDEVDNDCDGSVDEGVREPIGAMEAVVSMGEARPSQTPNLLAHELDDGNYLLVHLAADRSLIARVINGETMETLSTTPLSSAGSPSDGDFHVTSAQSGDRIAVIGSRFTFLAGRSFLTPGWMFSTADGSMVAGPVAIMEEESEDIDGVRVVAAGSGFAVFWISEGQLRVYPVLRSFLPVGSGSLEAHPGPLRSFSVVGEATLVALTDTTPPRLLRSSGAIDSLEWSEGAEIPDAAKLTGAMRSDGSIELLLTMESGERFTLERRTLAPDGTLGEPTSVEDAASRTLGDPVVSLLGEGLEAYVYQLTTTDSRAILYRGDASFEEHVLSVDALPYRVAPVPGGAFFVQTTDPTSGAGIGFRRLGCPE